ncbi:MAG: insulinase family protein [Bacilli bacterium]|nr:insulinase family protein [Bacilli bacterium]
MKQKKFSGINLEVFSETLDNGLRVYVVPMKDKHNIHATFSTNFGSIINEFVPIGENKMIRVPDGVAHFLEHKLFEQKNGIDPFTFFGENGADANANTSYFKTTYLFSGLKKFKENLNYLLDYVQEPYFTDENVEKEKGIIDQERSMYQDDPLWRMYEGSIYNLVNSHPIKFPIIGTKESIYDITKEDLYKCYNTFYHPSNMFVVVTGNVDPIETIKMIKENQSQKKFPAKPKIEIKKYKEDKNVAVKKQEIEMDINTSKVALSYKICIDNFQNYSLYEIYNYILYYFNIKIGQTSAIVEQLKKDNLIYDDFGFEINGIDNYLLINIFAETHDPTKVVNTLKKELNNKLISEEELERKKKCSISSLLASGDNLYRINNKIMSNIIKYDDVVYDDYERIKTLNYKDLNNIIDNISFDEYSIFIINPKKKDIQ